MTSLSTVLLEQVVRLCNEGILRYVTIESVNLHLNIEYIRKKYDSFDDILVTEENARDFATMLLIAGDVHVGRNSYLYSPVNALDFHIIDNKSIRRLWEIYQSYSYLITIEEYQTLMRRINPRCYISRGCDCSNKFQTDILEPYIEQKKNKKIWDNWEMETSTHTSYIQWLPREVTEDVISLL